MNNHATKTLKTKAFDSKHICGVLQILKFNWPFYAVALVVVISCVMGVVLAPLWARLLIAPVLSGALFWSVASLWASHIVYDLSPITRWDWIEELFSQVPRKAANIHAGFDETSRALRRAFPTTDLQVWDFYDRTLMTEASIARARKNFGATDAESIDAARLPAMDASLDAVFLLFAAHELRSATAREEFFRELRRVLRPEGTLIIVEHLRDWANFLAYGPGFLHFLPRVEWLRLARASGLSVKQELRMTHFVRAFHFERPL